MEYISPAKRCKNVTNNLKCDVKILILIIHEVIVSSFNCNFLRLLLHIKHLHSTAGLWHHTPEGNI